LAKGKDWEAAKEALKAHVKVSVTALSRDATMESSSERTLSARSDVRSGMHWALAWDFESDASKGKEMAAVSDVTMAQDSGSVMVVASDAMLVDEMVLGSGIC